MYTGAVFVSLEDLTQLLSMKRDNLVLPRQAKSEHKMFMLATLEGAEEDADVFRRNLQPLIAAMELHEKGVADVRPRARSLKAELTKHQMHLAELVKQATTGYDIHESALSQAQVSHMHFLLLSCKVLQ